MAAWRQRDPADIVEGALPERGRTRPASNGILGWHRRTLGEVHPAAGELPARTARPSIRLDETPLLRWVRPEVGQREQLRRRVPLHDRGLASSGRAGRSRPRSVPRDSPKMDRRDGVADRLREASYVPAALVRWVWANTWRFRISVPQIRMSFPYVAGPSQVSPGGWVAPPGLTVRSRVMSRAAWAAGLLSGDGFPVRLFRRSPGWAVSRCRVVRCRCRWRQTRSPTRVPGPYWPRYRLLLKRLRTRLCRSVGASRSATLARG